jgi:hypothetical protein
MRSRATFARPWMQVRRRVAIAGIAMSLRTHLAVATEGLRVPVSTA